MTTTRGDTVERSYSERLGIVVIGRNEGARLLECLDSLKSVGSPIIYVDSNSTDGSPETAAQWGAEVLRLDPSTPVCASRARAEGARRLMENGGIELLFFVDGDCTVQPDWLPEAVSALDAGPCLAAVCGRRRERFPDASCYNLVCDHEWDTPVGECASTGGDAVFRVEAYREAGGFDPSVPAGEEPELCHRLMNAGWKIRRIDAEMTTHDAAMTRFGQWWRRQVRTGYSGSDVEARFGLGLFGGLVRGAFFWTVGFPIAIATASVAGFFLGGPTGLLSALVTMMLVITAQVIRIASRIRSRPVVHRLQIALLTMLAKPAIAWGAACWWLDRRRGRTVRLVEYKQSAPTHTAVVS